jgi:hypothetical protein
MALLPAPVVAVITMTIIEKVSLELPQMLNLALMLRMATMTAKVKLNQVLLAAAVGREASAPATVQ